MGRLFAILLALGASLGVSFANAKPYKGAELYSKQSYLYGRYEVRMRVANASGVLSTFFTYKNGSEVDNTFWEEIDIEVFGKNNATSWQSNIILGSSRPTIQSHETHTVDGSLADAYHTYVLEWTPDYVAWYLDGVEVRRITGTSTVTSLTNPQSLRFNLWASESEIWAGAWDDSVLPVYQFVEYFEYKAYNPTSKTFEGGWRDDFNSFDSSRWDKANWTFDGNRVDFSPANVVIKNGVLVLALTMENATGYTGTPPTDAMSSSSSSLASSEASSSSNVSSVASSAAASVETHSSSAAASSIATSKTSGGGSGSGGGGGAFHYGWLLIMAGLLMPGLIKRRQF